MTPKLWWTPKTYDFWSFLLKKEIDQSINSIHLNESIFPEPIICPITKILQLLFWNDVIAEGYLLMSLKHIAYLNKILFKNYFASCTGEAQVEKWSKQQNSPFLAFGVPPALGSHSQSLTCINKTLVSVIQV